MSWEDKIDNYQNKKASKPPLTLGEIIITPILWLFEFIFKTKENIDKNIEESNRRNFNNTFICCVCNRHSDGPDYNLHGTGRYDNMEYHRNEIMERVSTWNKPGDMIQCDICSKWVHKNVCSYNGICKSCGENL
jgi:hypothetical protein